MDFLRARVDLAMAAAGIDREVQLGRAEGSYRAADVLMYASAVRLVRGALVGGAEGADLGRPGRDEMERIGVIRPGRLAAVFAPGLPVR